MTDRAVSPPDTIVLIHGLFLTGKSWERWVQRYSDRGFTVIAKSWPGMDVDIADLRKDTSAIDNLGIAEVADHYEKIVSDLDRPPIIIGHSFGGLITQILLQRGQGVAGVALDSAPFKGVHVVPPSTLRVGWPALKSPANAHRAVTLTPDEFHYAFTNAMTEDESRNVYERYAAPGPGRPLFQAALPTSLRIHPQPSTTATTSGRHSSSSPGRWTTCRPCPSTSPSSSTSRNHKRSPPTRNSPPASTSYSAKTVGKRSPTSPSLGPSTRSAESCDPETVCWRTLSGDRRVAGPPGPFGKKRTPA
jgi:pimeloyl-ACP methyl ester carboxylesterase